MEGLPARGIRPQGSSLDNEAASRMGGSDHPD